MLLGIGRRFGYSKKSKGTAAHRAGIRTVVMPKENEKDMPDVPEEVLEDVSFIFVETVDEAIRLAFGDSLARRRKRVSVREGRAPARPERSRRSVTRP